MDQFQYRRAARTVAYVDLVFCGITVIAIILVVLLGLFTTAVLVEHLDKHPDEDASFIVKAMLEAIWILLILGIIFGCIEIWAVVMLLKATKQGAEASQALHRAKIWRVVDLVDLAIGLLISLGLAEYKQLLSLLLIRGVMLYYVEQFIKELTGFVQNSGAQVA